MKTYLFFLIVLLNLPLTASASPPQNSTTIFYYLSGDNNLEFMMNGIIQRIEKFGSSSKVTALIQNDGPNHNDSSRFKVLKPKNMKAQRQVFQSNIEYDMGNIVTLRNFIDWGMASYPAEKYILYIAGHGLGIMEFDSTKKNNSNDFITLDVGVDWNSHSAMTINDLSNNLGELVSNNKKPFELIVFNSCLMGNLETIAGLKNITNFVLASEYEIQLYKPSFVSAQKTDAIGVDGATLLKTVKENYRNYSIQTIANAMTDQYRNSYKNGIYDFYLGDKRYLKATLSLYNTAPIDKLTELFAQFSTELKELIKSDLSIVDEIYIRTLATPLIYWFGYLDALETLNIIAEVTQLDSAQELVTQLESDNFMGPLALINVNNVSGLSFYFPKVILGNPSWNDYLETYLRQDFSLKTGWGNTLNEYARAWGHRRKSIIKSLLQSYFDGNPRIITESNELDKNIDYLKDIIFILLCSLGEDNKFDDIRDIVEMILAHQEDSITSQILDDIYRYILKNENQPSREKM